MKHPSTNRNTLTAVPHDADRHEALGLNGKKPGHTAPLPSQVVPIAPTFALLTESCAAHGISRSMAYKLIHDGLLDTFIIKRRRYVLLESLRTLPERLITQQVAA